MSSPTGDVEPPEVGAVRQQVAAAVDQPRDADGEARGVAVTAVELRDGLGHQAHEVVDDDLGVQGSRVEGQPMLTDVRPARSRASTETWLTLTSAPRP